MNILVLAYVEGGKLIRIQKSFLISNSRSSIQKFEIFLWRAPQSFACSAEMQNYIRYDIMLYAYYDVAIHYEINY